jgi:hypothetical protein
VDADRMAISEASAGGYTSLCALIFRDDFRTGSIYYGVSDLEALVRETHKFESHYLDSLIGPYPQQRDLYRERSPVHFANRFAAPVAFFQGTDRCVKEKPNEKTPPFDYFAFGMANDDGTGAPSGDSRFRRTRRHPTQDAAPGARR